MFRVVVSGLVALMLCLLGSGCMPGGSNDSDSPEAVVETYLEAHNQGDAQNACEQLSEGQQYEMVARVTGNRSATPSQCESLVLQTSPRSTAVRPELASFVNAKLETRPGKAGSINVAPAGSREFLELIKEDGEWKIDGRAAEKESFLKVHCPERGYDATTCECIFEQLRHADVNIYDPSTPATVIRNALAGGVRTCTDTS